MSDQPHLLHAVIDQQWLGYEIECPYEPTDPKRPCTWHEEDSEVEQPGCGVNAWLDGDGAWDRDDSLSMRFTRQRLTGPLPVAVRWDEADEFWDIGPWAP